MKLFLSVFITGLMALSSYATTPDELKIYLTSHMEVTENKKEASYVCKIVEETDLGYHVKAYFLTGELKMDGWFRDKELTQPHGEFTYYYQNGQIESKGEFREGSKFGLWQRYDFEGNPKPEKIYATLQIMQAISEK